MNLFKPLGTSLIPTESNMPLVGARSIPLEQAQTRSVPGGLILPNFESGCWKNNRSFKSR